MEIGRWIITDSGVGCKDRGGIKILALNRSYPIVADTSVRRVHP